MHTDKAIAEFEAWWDRQPHREQFADLKQQFCNVAVAFYQKSREDQSGFIDALDWYAKAEPLELYTNAEIEEYQRRARLALEAAGVTVRG